MKRSIREKGATVIEFALAVPIFIILIIGIIDFGWYFFTQHTIQYATREGARIALVGKTIDDMDRSATVIKVIQESAGLAVDPEDLDIRIYPLEDDFSDPAGWQGLTPNAGAPGAIMRVRARYTYHFLTPIIGSLVSNGKILVEAQATYKNEIFEE